MYLHLEITVSGEDADRLSDIADRWGIPEGEALLRAFRTGAMVEQLLLDGSEVVITHRDGTQAMLLLHPGGGGVRP